MKRSGADLAVYALEQLGITRTFGIPGVHNTELYDALDRSQKITPFLVTHELCAAFIADGISRTSSEIGTIVIVPGAGTTHAMSGICEAHLDGVPMLVISGGIRRDSGRAFQLHDIDQRRLLEPVTKRYVLVERHDQVVPAIFTAFEAAVSGVPGPAFVEIPVEIQMFRGEVDDLPEYPKGAAPPEPDDEAVEQAAMLLAAAKRPGIYVGWGAVDAVRHTIALAETLGAPVATTLQGLSAFPASHPLHTGVGFGPSAVPAAREAFSDCDCLLAAGVRFSELATGSYGLPVPKNLIHVDIDESVFDRNYPARVKVTGDATQVLSMLVDRLTLQELSRDTQGLTGSIARAKEKHSAQWLEHTSEARVSPGHFFENLRRSLPPDAFMVVDDGKHTFLAAELFPVLEARRFISPTDFNSMGYCIPASIGVKMTHPETDVVAIVGDGAFMMTCMELITAAQHGVGVAVFVFHDGELGQISQFQQIPLNRKTCTVLGDLNVAGVAAATGCAFLPMETTADIEAVSDEALATARAGRPVIVDVRIDYTRKTCMTKGVVKTNLARFPLAEKVRFIGRAAKRHIGKAQSD